MELADGITLDEFIQTLNEAEVSVIECPRCERITRVEPLDDSSWLCYECGGVFNV